MNDLTSSPPGVVVPVEFRDGVHHVPQYILSMIVQAGIDTLAVTYEEARRLSANAGLRNYLNGQMERLISQHRKDWGG